MGCGTSKPTVCQKCQAPRSPVRRSYSVEVNHHHHHHHHHLFPETRDTYHVMSLMSSTLASLNLDPADPNLAAVHKLLGEPPPATESLNQETRRSAKEVFEIGMIEAKTWSLMINEKIPKRNPKTPIRTPPGEPETIDASELMEGLEDISLLPLTARHFRSISLHVPSSTGDNQAVPHTEIDVGPLSPPIPPCPHSDHLAGSATSSNSNNTSIVSEFDPDLFSIFRKALDELPPATPLHFDKHENQESIFTHAKHNHQPVPHAKDDVGPVSPPKTTWARCPDSDHFDNSDTNLISNSTSIVSENQETTDTNPDSHENQESLCTPALKARLTMYLTSLRGVRKTYEDCCHVRDVLRGLGVRLDERDVSMHSRFKDELKQLLGDGLAGFGLPRVFISDRYIGGAEDIRRLNEEGTLGRLVEECELVGECDLCEACGDIRFVPCGKCWGSCKIYCEEGGLDCCFRRCSDCNENGLVRCPICCD